jgi:flagellar biogenesis protein FliO
LWLFRHSQRFAFRNGRAPKLSVLEAKSLGQRHTLFVVGYDKQRMLVAASPTGITLLSSLPEAGPEEAPVIQPAVRSSLHDFPALLLQAVGRKA